MKRIYLSGPMTNMLDLNSPAFHSTAASLRAERDKLAPAVRAQAHAGAIASAAAVALKMHIKRVQLIARENGFAFAES